MAEEFMPADDLVFPGPNGAVVNASNAGVARGDAFGLPTDQAAPAVAGQQRPALRWIDAMSSFVLHRMCQLISIGVRTDKGFKEVHLNQVAEALQKFSGNEVSGTQVYNHMRKWKQRYVKVTKLKELSGALWDEEHSMIVLGEEHYNGYTKVCGDIKVCSSL
jgi:hypothetical protein